MYKQDVIDYYNDNQSEVARTLDITRQAVGLWEEIIPEKHAMKLDRLTQDDEFPLVYCPELYEVDA